MFKIVLNFFRLLLISNEKICCDRKMKFIGNEDKGEWFHTHYYKKYSCKTCGKINKITHEEF